MDRGGDAALIVALGPGAPDALTLGAVAALRGAGEADLGAPGPLRSAVEELGVRHRTGAPVVARGDAEAWRRAQAHPDAATVPDREALEQRAAAASLAELFGVTLRLRRDCPWDREQTAASIVPHTLEEAYEVAEKALAGPPDAALVDELGDLLFQTYFLAVLTREAGVGDLQAEAEGIRDKLVRRHPHVYGEPEPVDRRDAAVVDADGVRSRWETIKREQEGRRGIFHDVPSSLPALLHARKVQRRVAAVGFDWARWEDAWPSLLDETAELREALELAEGALGREIEPPAHVRHEAGDLLFAAVNVLRLAGVDPELALRAASGRFRRRVEGAEGLAAVDGRAFDRLGLEEQDGYYRAAKRATDEAQARPHPTATPAGDPAGQETSA